MEIFSMVLSLLSGVALFLFGMSLMGDGLKQAAGNKLEAFLYKMTNTPLKEVTLWYRSNKCHSVIFRDDSYGHRFC